MQYDMRRGCATFLSVNKQRDVSISLLAFAKALRYVMGAACMVAFEFLWTFVANGPMYATAAAYNHDKCARNHWLSVLLVANALHADQIVMPIQCPFNAHSMLIRTIHRNIM